MVEEKLATVQSKHHATRLITEIISQTIGWKELKGDTKEIYRKGDISYGYEKKGIRMYCILKNNYQAQLPQYLLGGEMKETQSKEQLSQKSEQLNILTAPKSKNK